MFQEVYYQNTLVDIQRSEFALRKLISFTEAHVNAPRKQVVVRTIPTNSAGLGSVVVQLRSSTAIATMLGAEFSTFSIISTHLTQYRAASLMKVDLLGTELPKGSKVCSIAWSLHEACTAELMENWCNNEAHGEAYAQELQQLWSDCNLIIDDRAWDVWYDMSKCTWKWVKHVFTALGLKQRRGGESGCTSDGATYLSRHCHLSNPRP